MIGPAATATQRSGTGSGTGSEAGAGGGDGRAKISLRGVSKSFGELRVLDGLDFDAFAGDSVVILGGSGTGKSVLLKHIIGLLRPDSGTVEIDGVDLADLAPRELTSFRRRFGMAFQEGALFDSMTVRENVAFPLRRAKRSPEEIDRRVAECLSLVRLHGADHKLPAEISGGMRRRVGFARAIALEPEILLFDEPTTGLDPVIKAVIDELILEVQASLGSTAITITHDLASAFRIADKIAMLHRGKIVAYAAPGEFRQLDDPRVQQFLRGEASGPLTAADE